MCANDIKRKNAPVISSSIKVKFRRGEILYKMLIMLCATLYSVENGRKDFFKCSHMEENHGNHNG